MLHPRLASAYLASALVACGGGGDPPADPDAPVTAADAARADAASPTADAAPCATIDACGWLVDYEQEVVAKLAGAAEIAPGVTIAQRATAVQREAVRTYLEAELVRWGYTPSRHAYAPNGANVIATLPATTGSGATIVVGAHFDSVPIAPGAADNATGTAVVLAAARYLATVPDRTHPITFALFDQEEIGLVGSDAFAQRLVDDATAVAAVHNFDMISYDGDHDQAVELWSPAPALEAAYRAVASARGIAIEPTPFQYSDHQAFLDHGFPAVGVSEEYVNGDHTPHYHKATDTYDKVDFPYLATVSALGITVIAGAATE